MRGSRGHTLVELALALGLVGTMGMATAGVLVRTWGQQRRAWEVHAAALAASAKVEELRALPYEQVRPHTWQPPGFAAGEVAVSEVPEGAGALKKVTVTVHRAAGGPPVYTLVAYVRRRG